MTEANTNPDNNKIPNSPGRKPAPGVMGGSVLILVGSVFLLAQMERISWDHLWAYFLVGFGTILIVTGFLGIGRQGRRPTRGRFIGGVILIVIGAANIIGLHVWWPYLLIVLGLMLVVSALFPSRS
jgi:hypothetical protein